MKTEVKVFAEEGKYIEQIDFGTAQLWYGLRAGAENSEVSATMSENEVMINVPSLIAKNWVDSEEVGFGAEQALPNGGFLKIIVEKDFHCLSDREGEDESDAYKNPNMKNV